MPGMLHGVVLRGFSDPGERASFLAHFGLGCPTCEEHFLNWAMLPGPLPLESATGPEVLYDPPRRALLRRRANLRGAFGLDEVSSARGAGRQEPHLRFLRLALEEARHASLGLPQEAAVACIRHARDDLRLLRHFLAHEGSPRGCPSVERIPFELAALDVLACEMLGAELQCHGAHLEAETLRHEAATTRLLSQAGRCLDDYLDGVGG